MSEERFKSAEPTEPLEFLPRSRVEEEKMVLLRELRESLKASATPNASVRAVLQPAPFVGR